MKFSEYVLDEARKTKISTRLNILVNMLKPYNTGFKTYGNIVKFGFYEIEVTMKEYIITKRGQHFGTYKDVRDIEGLVEKDYLPDMHETLSVAQKEHLKVLFIKSMDKFDDNMSIKDFAIVVGELS